LGAHMVGAEVTELIQGFVIAMNLETTEEELMHAVFPHPTLSEMLHESVLAAYGRALHISTGARPRHEGERWPLALLPPTTRPGCATPRRRRARTARPCASRTGSGSRRRSRRNITRP